MLTGLAMVFSAVLVLDILFCPIHKKPTIWEQMFLVSSQTDNPQFSFIMYHFCIDIEDVNLSIHVKNY